MLIKPLDINHQHLLKTMNISYPPWDVNHIFYVDDDSAFVHFVSFQMLKKAFYNTDIMKVLGGVKLIDSKYCNIYLTQNFISKARLY